MRWQLPEWRQFTHHFKPERKLELNNITNSNLYLCFSNYHALRQKRTDSELTLFKTSLFSAKFFSSEETLSRENPSWSALNQQCSVQCWYFSCPLNQRWKTQISETALFIPDYVWDLNPEGLWSLTICNWFPAARNPTGKPGT